MKPPNVDSQAIQQILDQFNGQILVEKTHLHLDQILINLHGALQALDRINSYVRNTANQDHPQEPR